MTDSQIFICKVLQIKKKPRKLNFENRDHADLGKWLICLVKYHYRLLNTSDKVRNFISEINTRVPLQIQNIRGWSIEKVEKKYISKADVHSYLITRFKKVCIFLKFYWPKVFFINIKFTKVVNKTSTENHCNCTNDPNIKEYFYF